MPKLNPELAGQVADAGSSTFDPVPDGAYVVRLVDVDGSRSGAAGPYWSWEFDIEDPEHSGRKLWNNTSLSEAAQWKLKEAFDAFDAETDTDTDELIGRRCLAIVSTRTIQQGARAGQQANQIDRLAPATEQALKDHGVTSADPDEAVF